MNVWREFDSQIYSSINYDHENWNEYELHIMLQPLYFAMDA